MPHLQVADLPSLQRRLAELEAAAAAGEFWERRGAAQVVLQQLTALREEAAQLQQFSAQLDDLAVALELLEMEVGRWGGGQACELPRGVSSWTSHPHIQHVPSYPSPHLQEEEGTAGTAAAGVAPAIALEAAALCGALGDGLEGWELRRLLGGPYDATGAVLSIQAGAGGTDAQDWAEMLARMYVRWAEKQGHATRVIDRQAGECIAPVSGAASVPSAPQKEAAFPA